MDKIEAFARQWESQNMAAARFNEPPIDEDDLPPLKMPPPPRAPEDDSVQPHPPWPRSPLAEIAAPPISSVGGLELEVIGPHGSYRGQKADLNAKEQAAIGRIVLEAAQRVIREHLAAVRKTAPRRVNKPDPPVVAEVPKRRRGRPPKQRPPVEAQNA